MSFSLNNLGLVLFGQGDFKTARAAYERALAVRERVYGADNPQTAVVLHNLAELLRETGDRATARRYLQQALKIREAGGSQAGVASTVNSLGNLSVAEGELADGRARLERARTLALGKKSGIPDLEWRAASGLGAVYEKGGRLLEAAVLYREATRTLEAMAGQFDESDFMVTFHREIGAGPAVALQKAQRDILARPATAHPYYWAAFVLIGAR